jgi:hypothetical protein
VAEFRRQAAVGGGAPRKHGQAVGVDVEQARGSVSRGGGFVEADAEVVGVEDAQVEPAWRAAACTAAARPGHADGEGVEVGR